VRSLSESVSSTVSTPRRSIGAQHNDSKSYEQLENELETLKSQYMRVQKENDNLRAQLDERKNWPKDLQKMFSVVQVVGGDGGQQSLTLQPRGVEDPVHDSPVLYGFSDVVGRLRIVGPGTTTVSLITAAKFSVRGEFTHYIADGSGVERIKVVSLTGDGRGNLIASDKLVSFQRSATDKQLKVAVGDRVILSDPDWPSIAQGFCIGEITKIDPKGLFCDFVVRPRSDLMKLKEVMVLKK